MREVTESCYQPSLPTKRMFPLVPFLLKTHEVKVRDKWQYRLRTQDHGRQPHFTAYCRRACYISFAFREPQISVQLSNCPIILHVSNETRIFVGTWWHSRVCSADCEMGCVIHSVPAPGIEDIGPLFRATNFWGATPCISLLFFSFCCLYFYQRMANLKSGLQ